MSPDRRTITAVEPQQRGRDRVSLFLDGEFALGVHAEVALALGWKAGDVVSETDVREAARREELRAARDAALRLLAVRARSAQELRTRLRRKGYEDDLIAETLAALARSGLLDDAAFAQAWVRHRTTGASLGRNRIATELRQKGVERETTAEALAEVTEEDEYARALEWARRKLPSLRGEDDRAVRRKLSAALARRGYGWDICSRVLRALGAEEEA